MRSYIKNILAAAVITAMLQIASCTTESCLEETVAEIKAPFYLNSTKIAKSPDSLTIYGLNTGSKKLYNSVKGVSRANLPLDPAAYNCGFVLRINGVSDTIHLAYDSYPHFISKECGYTYYHTIDSISYSKHIIDTIIVRNRLVTIINEENFRILY